MTTGRAASCTVGAILLFALAGCGGPRAAGPSAERDEQASSLTQPQSTARAFDENALPASGRVALGYTMAARSWTPVNYRAQQRQRLRLSTGSLRRALEGAPPTRGQIAAYHADDARLEATALAAISLLQTTTQARYRLTLDERSVAAGQTIQQRVTYLLELQRRGGRWLVAAFTIEP